MSYLDLGYNVFFVKEEGERQKLGRVSLSELRAILPAAFIGADLKVRAGQDDYADGTGYFLGKSSGVYKFSIGDDNNYIRWDGTDIEIKGLLTLLSIVNNKTYMVANLPIPPTSEGPNSPSAVE